MCVRLALGVPVHDATAGYRAYRREVLEELPVEAIRSNGYCFQIELVHPSTRPDPVDQPQGQVRSTCRPSSMPIRVRDDGISPRSPKRRSRSPPVVAMTFSSTAQQFVWHLNRSTTCFSESQ
jgi:hypothetical protein